LHPIARLDGRIHEIVDFDYDAVDGPQPEATAPVSQMAAGLCEILSCLAKGRNLKTSGARVLALLAMLDPIKQSMRNLSEVARLAGCSRAALSKFLVNFRDTYGFGLIAGKLQGSRAAYREGQLRSLRNSTHSSFCRKDAKTIQPHKMVMNTSVEPKTLDAAKTALEQAHDEIAQLKAQLASRPRQNAPATTTAAATPEHRDPTEIGSKRSFQSRTHGSFGSQQ